MMEIKRKANAGERIKIVSAGFTFGDYANGTEMVVEKRENDRAVIVEDYGVPNGVNIIADYEYVVLEPDAEYAGITLLPDESLGGISREYREVKRKACVGERIKITAEMRFGERREGEIYTVTRMSGYGLVDTDGKWGDGSTLNLPVDEYVVLEASDILVIDGAKFRMVNRKAAVGERVIVIDDRDGTGGSDGHFFRVGNVGVYCGDDDVDFSGCGNNYVYHDGNWSVTPDARRVLEPLTSAELASTPTPLSELSALPLVDQYAENITVLTRKIIALEERILALETDSAPSYVKVASGPVDNTLPSFSKAPVQVADAYAVLAAKMFATPPVKSAQKIRDEIVERAKADVSDPHKFAGTPIAREGLRFWPHGSGFVTHAVEYVVSRDKRTVVALVIETYGGRKIVARGIAKCAPGEVFNSALGKAIALYRALGLEVPAEYLTCPQPETVRVGDVVNGGVVYALRPTHRTVWVNQPQAFVSADTGYMYIDKNGREAWSFIAGAQIIDDSREDGGQSAASSALKGAA